MKPQYARSIFRRYVLRWQSPLMHAPAFWYYDAEESALLDAREMSTRNFVEVARLTLTGRSARTLYRADGRTA